MFTRYQKGTWILTAYREGGVVAALRLKTVRSVATVDDPDEKWLQDFPEEHRVTFEEAIEALEMQTALWDAEKYECDDSLVKLIEKRNNAIKAAERDFVEGVTVALGRAVEASELEALLESYPRLAEEKRERTARLDPIRLKVGTKWALGQIARRKAYSDNWTNPTTRRADDTKEVKERQQMELMRAIIEREEQKLRRSGD